jgi:hypothetical protein
VHASHPAVCAAEAPAADRGRSATTEPTSGEAADVAASAAESAADVAASAVESTAPVTAAPVTAAPVATAAVGGEHRTG